MAGKRNFGAHGKDTNLRIMRRILRRQDKSRFGIVELRCDRLHLRGRQPTGIEHHGERIAAEGAVGENVYRDVTPLHSMPSYPNCHTVIGRSYPLIATSPSGTASVPSSPSASRTLAETRSCELNSLLSASSLAAKFTVSPITVYSF